MASGNISQQPRSFQCITIALSKDEYIDVTSGDFLGVTMFRNVLPVVGNSNSITRWSDSVAVLATNSICGICGEPFFSCKLTPYFLAMLFMSQLKFNR